MISSENNENPWTRAQSVCWRFYLISMIFERNSEFEDSHEYICKIGEILLRERIQPDSRQRTKSDRVFQSPNTLHSRSKSEKFSCNLPKWRNSTQLSLDIDSRFWRNGDPLYFDIITRDGVLLERWIINFQSRYLIYN